MSIDAFERRLDVSRHFVGRVCNTEWDDNCRNIEADGYNIRVFLNGREYEDWSAADSERGTLVTSNSAIFQGQVEIRLERSDPVPMSVTIRALAE